MSFVLEKLGIEFLLNIDSNTILSISSAFIATFSAFVAYFSYKQNSKSYIISQTPILIPTFVKIDENKYELSTLNTHKSAIAKEVSISLKGGKLKQVYKKENEFLTPDMRTLPLQIMEENIDGASFEITYKNIFGKNIESKGVVYEIKLNNFDFQNMNFIIKSITD